MKIKNKQLLIADFLTVFGPEDKIAAVYLFGSHAEGSATAASDIDLAIVPHDGAVISSQEVQRLHQRLDSLGYPHCDLVVLDGSNLLLAYESVKHNYIVYATPGFRPGQYFSKVHRFYLDFQPYLDKRRAALKRRILDSSL
jgi:predicted nucleotidyltransferase